MKKPNKKTSLWLGAVALFAVLALSKVFNSGEGRSPQPAQGGSRAQVVNVQVMPLHPEKVKGSLTAVGTLLSNEEIEVRSQTSGQVSGIHFKEGTAVKRGDLLVKVNDDELQAQLLRAQSRLAIAGQNAVRQQQLFEKEFVSQEEYNNVLNELNIMKAEVQLIEAQIDRTELRAPFDGTIGLRMVSVGSYISPATVVTTLQDNSRMRLDFTVPERFAGEVVPGDKVVFRVASEPREFEATVVSRDSRLDQATRTLRIRAHASNPRGILLPGSFATVELQMRERETIMVPSFAVIPELRGHRVFVLKNGIAESPNVEIGMRTEERVEILSGVQRGDTLIVSAILQLRPGMAVRPVSPQQGVSPQ